MKMGCAIGLALLLPLVMAGAPTTTRPGEFVEVGSDAGGHFFSQVIYCPPMNGLMSWGTRVHGQPIRTHETQHFLAAENKWVDAFPPAKEETWAKQPYKTWGDWNYASGVGSFYERDGVKMPRPNTSFYQLCWDAENQRVLYYLGSMTFSYAPAKREWKVIHEKNAKDQPPANVLWGSLCYDPANKQALLFGGGAIDAADGNPHTWAFDVTKDTWRRLDLKAEPPARCNSRMVYDAKNKVIVLFGGDAQDRGLADTWVFDVTKQEWQERKPAQSPSPRWNHALAYLEKSGVVLLAGGVPQAPYEQVRNLRSQVWVYDAAANTWTPLAAKPPTADWMSMENVPGTDEVVLVTSGKFNHSRKTYRFACTPAIAGKTGTGTISVNSDGNGASPRSSAEIKGVPPGTFAYKTSATKESFEAVPAADRAAHEKEIAGIAVNEWVEMKPPKTTIGRTWGTSLFDTDRAVAMKWGGGHSGYQGTDMAFYDVAANRFSIDHTPEFTPDPYDRDATRPPGRSYSNTPWARHMRHTCAYDNVRKVGVFADAGGASWYDRASDKMVMHTWLYDPAKRAWLEPIVQPFPGGSAVSPIAFPTTNGVLVYHVGRLWWFLGGWEEVKLEGPDRPPQQEMMTIVYDEKRDRLIMLSGDKTGPELWFCTLSRQIGKTPRGQTPISGTWKKNPQPAPGGLISREAVYVPDQDAVLAYGPAQKDDAVWTRVYLCAENRWVPLSIKTPQYAVYEVGLEYDPTHKVAVFLWYPSFENGIRPHLFRLDAGKLAR